MVLPTVPARNLNLEPIKTQHLLGRPLLQPDTEKLKKEKRTCQFLTERKFIVDHTVYAH